jgi:hypothetical protein
MPALRCRRKRNRMPSPPRPILEKFLPLSTSCAAPTPCPECSQFPRMDPEAKARRYKGATGPRADYIYRYRMRMRAVSVPDNLFYVRGHAEIVRVYTIQYAPPRDGAGQPVHPGPGRQGPLPPGQGGTGGPCSRRPAACACRPAPASCADASRLWAPWTGVWSDLAASGAGGLVRAATATA